MKVYVIYAFVFAMLNKSLRNFWVEIHSHCPKLPEARLHHMKIFTSQAVFPPEPTNNVERNKRVSLILVYYYGSVQTKLTIANTFCYKAFAAAQHT